MYVCIFWIFAGEESKGCNGSFIGRDKLRTEAQFPRYPLVPSFIIDMAVYPSWDCSVSHPLNQRFGIYGGSICCNVSCVCNMGINRNIRIRSYRWNDQLDRIEVLWRISKLFFDNTVERNDIHPSDDRNMFSNILDCHDKIAPTDPSGWFSFHIANIFEYDKCARVFRSQPILGVGDISLRLHDTSLPSVDRVLKVCDSDQGQSQKYLQIVRELQINKTFLARGLPMAFGWLIVSSAIGFYLAKIGHDRESALLTISAVILYVLIIPTFFAILIWRDGYFAENVSASLRIDASATRYCGLENVGVHPVVVAELKFSDVQRQIFAAYFVEAPHDAALEQRPKAVNRLGVNHTVNILFFGMADEGMREIFFEMPVAGMFVSHKQADVIGNGLTNKPVQGAVLPPSLVSGSIKAARILWHMECAVP